MKPFLNLDELTEFEETSQGSYHERYVSVAERIGAQKLGYSLSVIPSGGKACPFHNHHVNEEMFLVLNGEGLLRFGENEYNLKKHDIIACPPGGREVAHQIINTGTEELRYLSLSTNEPHEICEYPDSDKILAFVGKWGERSLQHMTRRESAVDYYDGEF